MWRGFYWCIITLLVPFFVAFYSHVTFMICVRFSHVVETFCTLCYCIVNNAGFVMDDIWFVMLHRLIMK